MNRLSVLHWAPQSGSETGTGQAIDAWTQASSAAGAEVLVVSQNRPTRSGEPGEVSYLGGQLGRWGLLKTFSRQIRNIDVVHLHGAFDPTLSLILFIVGVEKLRRRAHRNRLIAVLTPHGALSDYVFQKNRTKKWLYWNLLDKWLIRLSDALICNTPVEQHQLKKRLPNAHYFTIPLAVDLPDSLNINDSSDNPRQPGIPVLCTIGRYDIHIKGLDILIRAVVRLNREGETVRLRCIGYDRQRGTAELQKFVDSEGAGSLVECVGPKFGSEKYHLLRQSTVFCMPSRYESFSYSLLEGMQSGRPVLIGSGACLTSYFDKDQKELLVVDPTVDVWVAAIRRVIASPAPNRDCTARAYQTFCNLFSPEVVGKALLETYQNLVSSVNNV